MRFEKQFMAQFRVNCILGINGKRCLNLLLNLYFCKKDSSGLSWSEMWTFKDNTMEMVIVATSATGWKLKNRNERQ